MRKLWFYGEKDCICSCAFWGGNTQNQMEEFFKAIQMFPEIEFVITKANADQGGSYINKILEETEPFIPNMHVYASLGVVRYLSLMKHARFVLGNSSSGIIETPGAFFGHDRGKYRKRQQHCS